MQRMLRDVIPLSRIVAYIRHGTAAKATIAFVTLIEQRLGGQFVYDSHQFPLGRPELRDLHMLSETLMRHRVIKKFVRSITQPDEPPVRSWIAELCSKSKQFAEGLSSRDDRYAMTAALAEALERYIWSEVDDYFRSPFTSTAHKAATKNAVGVDRFVGFSSEIRAHDKKLQLNPEAQYTWIRGYSWVSRTRVYIPAQIVSAAYFRAMRKKTEPIIRFPITTGLATWPTREGTVLSGALEIIERDAFMIMWLNQLTLPRIAWTGLRQYESLDYLLRKCAQYRLTPHLIDLITDAPARAACVVVEDKSDEGPPITVGLKAGTSLAHAAEGALLEALRARRTARFKKRQNKWVPDTKPADVHQWQRVLYWSEKERYKNLSFLYAGSVQEYSKAAWENETKEEHLSRIIDWCRGAGYECASVDLGQSAKNPTPWHIAMVVIPELQPMHHSEQHPYTDGIRVQAIPQKFGYTARTVPFFEEPHPFV